MQRHKRNTLCYKFIKDFFKNLSSSFSLMSPNIASDIEKSFL